MAIDIPTRFSHEPVASYRTAIPCLVRLAGLHGSKSDISAALHARNMAGGMRASLSAVRSPSWTNDTPGPCGRETDVLAISRLIELAAELGLAATPAQIDWQGLENTNFTHPILVLLKNTNAVIVMGSGRDGGAEEVAVWEPLHSVAFSISRSTFEKTLTGHALIVTPLPSSKPETSSSGISWFPLGKAPDEGQDFETMPDQPSKEASGQHLSMADGSEWRRAQRSQPAPEADARLVATSVDRARADMNRPAAPEADARLVATSVAPRRPSHMHLWLAAIAVGVASFAAFSFMVLQGPAIVASPIASAPIDSSAAQPVDAEPVAAAPSAPPIAEVSTDAVAAPREEPASNTASAPSPTRESASATPAPGTPPEQPPRTEASPLSPTPPLASAVENRARPQATPSLSAAAVARGDGLAVGVASFAAFSFTVLQGPAIEADPDPILAAPRPKTPSDGPAVLVASPTASAPIDSLAAQPVDAEPVNTASAPSPTRESAAMPPPGAPPEQPPRTEALPLSPTPTPASAVENRARPQATPSLSAAALVARGDGLLGAGDVAAARLFYERAADAGDGLAALRLGKTFDPAFLEQTHLGRVQANFDTALSWYRRARDLGVAEAELLLNRAAAK